MTTSHLYSCLNCGRQYNPKVLKKCPVCQTAHLQSQAPIPSSSAELGSVSSSFTAGNRDSSNPSPKNSFEKDEYGRVAKNSARIVNSYGFGIQVFGVVSGIIVFLYFSFAFGDSYGGRAQYIFLGLIFGAITIGANLILGALYRMLANYVLFKTSE